jgi:hypothetical protein
VGRRRQHELETLHRFTPWYVETRWTVRARTDAHARSLYGADVSFPSTGPDARVTAVLRDGGSVPVADQPVPLDFVSYFSVRSASSGYVIVPSRHAAGATATTVPVAPQWSAPQAGPSLMITLARARRFRTLSLAARVVPVPRADAVDATARRLGAR